jgi:hypothetical protein
MSQPAPPPPEKLIFSLLSVSPDLIDAVISDLKSIFGEPDYISDLLNFEFTDYYIAEMGTPLKRRFISMATLVAPDKLAGVKLKSNEIESEHLNEHDGRLINIDPGLVSTHRLVLATGKDAPHRIYLGNGIFADLTLIYRQGDFQPLHWTYPDYSSRSYRDILKDIRGKYLLQLKDIHVKNHKLSK